MRYLAAAMHVLRLLWGCAVGSLVFGCTPQPKAPSGDTSGKTGALEAPASPPGAVTVTPPSASERDEEDPCARAELVATQTGTVDPVFLRLAEATGGKAVDMRNLPPDGSGALFEGKGNAIARLALLDKVSEVNEHVTVLIDPTVTRLSLQACGPDGAQVSLLDPKGGRHEPSNARSGRLDFDVLDPASGAWRVELANAQGRRVRIEVQGTSSLTSRVEVKRRGGRPGHRGWFPIEGHPLLGEAVLLQASLELTGKPTASLRDVRLGLVDRQGRIRWLDTSKLPAGGLGSAAWAAEGQLREGERVVVAGTLAGGEAFQRESTSIGASPFLLQPVQPGGNRLDMDRIVVPSRWTELPVEVVNSGSTGPVVVATATGVAGSFDVRIEPDRFVLEKDARRKLSVFIRARSVPASGTATPAMPTSGTALLTVGATPDDPAGNTLTVSAFFGADTDGDGIADDAERKQAPDFDGNGDGIADYQQSEVASFPVSLYSFSLVLAKGAVLGRLEPFTVLGKDVPNGEFAPYGAWQLGLDPKAKQVPKSIELLTGKVVGYQLQHLMVLGDDDQWQPRADYDAARGGFLLVLSPEEQRRFRAGTLAIAPTGTY